MSARDSIVQFGKGENALLLNLTYLEIVRGLVVENEAED